MSTTSDWDGRRYHRISDPQFAWGLPVLSRLTLRGDETVLDAGCGTGRLTARLLERLPRGKVIAVDRSPSMLAEARATLAGAASPVVFLEADLVTMELPERVHAIFSTATFHWIHDHPALFARLFDALFPGGRLEAQCGGGANLARLHARAARRMSEPRFAPWFADWRDPWEFANESTTAERLEGAGFREVRTWLHEAPTPFERAEDYREFVTSVVLRPHLAKLPDESARAEFVDSLVEEASRDDPPFVLDYWRLNLSARRDRESRAPSRAARPAEA